MSLYLEILEQPAVYQKLLARQAEVNVIAEEILRRRLRYAFLAARGTSDNAARYANYLWGVHNRLPVALAAPSLFTYYHRPPDLDEALVVGISQSGSSPDILAVVREGRRQGCMTLAITNAPGSPLARAAEFVIDVRAGKEEAIAATKSYTAEMLALAMLSVALERDDRHLSELALLPGWASQVLGLDTCLAQLAPRYRYMEHCTVIGRGFNYATAFEWSLKLKELTYIVAEPYSSADFMHGPVAMVERGFPVLVIATNGSIFESLLKLIRLLHAQGAELVVISDRQEALELAHSPIEMPPGIPEWLSPLIAILPAQLFCYHLTRARGLDTESPRRLRKVTKTR